MRGETGGKHPSGWTDGQATYTAVRQGWCVVVQDTAIWSGRWTVLCLGVGAFDSLSLSVSSSNSSAVATENASASSISEAVSSSAVAKLATELAWERIVPNWGWETGLKDVGGADFGGGRTEDADGVGSGAGAGGV